MSQSKRRLEEEEARGFQATYKQVCPECLEDEAVCAVIAGAAVPTPCSYCGKQPSAPLDEVLSHVLEALSLEYGSWEEENPGWDHEDGRYTARDFWLPDLIFDHLDGDWTPRLEADITSAVIDQSPWFERNAYALREHEQLTLSWRRFASTTSRRRANDLRPRARPSSDPDDWIDPQWTLDFIAETLLGLPEAFPTMPTGTRLWRVRSGNHTSAAELGPIPAGVKKSAGRMTPAGLNWFYGASDRETALLEKHRWEDKEPLSVVAFSTVAPMPVLDLSGDGLELPSIYDLDRQRGRTAVRFLRAFAGEISKPARGTDSPTYIPTQLVTRYIHDELARVTPIEGIVYPSSRGPGVNVVLFHGADACLDPGVRRKRRSRLRNVPSTRELIAAGRARAIRTRWNRRERKGRSGKPDAWSLWRSTL